MSTGCRSCIYGLGAQQSIHLEHRRLDEAAVVQQCIDQARAECTVAPDEPIPPCGYILAVHDELHVKHHHRLRGLLLAADGRLPVVCGFCA